MELAFFTETHQQFYQSATALVEKEIAPYVNEWEEAREFPAHAVFKKLGDAGLLGVHKPEAYGGLGLDYTYNMAAALGLATIQCGGIPMAIGVQTDMATPALAMFGSDALKETYLRPAIAGDMVACLGVSEPGAGSDVAAIKTHARTDGDDLIINGQKMWITNSLQADFMVALVNTGDGGRHANKSLIIIPMDTPGVERAKKLEKMGMHSSDTGIIHFDDVRVPRSNIIGEEGRGFSYQMMQFQEERLWAAVNTLPGLEASIRETIDYTRERKIFGKSVLDNQVVHFRLAELETEIELFKALIEKAVDQYKEGKDITRLASMLKLKAGRLSREVNDSCLQYWGGMGYMAETPISRRYRDGRLGSIGGGADEVMLGILCKMNGTLPQG